MSVFLRISGTLQEAVQAQQEEGGLGACLIVCQVLEIVFNCILMLSSVPALISEDFLPVVTSVFCYTC